MKLALEMWGPLLLSLAWLWLELSPAHGQAGCSMHNNCNGHGLCRNTYSQCDCYEGWGAATDIADYKAPDCSLRTCPAGRAWGDVPTRSNMAHALAECSNRGTCNRKTGLCQCQTGFTGDACQRMFCPNDCSGHGECMSMKQMASQPNALPLSNATIYTGYQDTITWDEDMIYGCVCDSSWPVGFGPGQVQEPEWFGPDCSFRHCPSGDDPETARNETNCHNKTATGGHATGLYGNLCQVDCSNRGLCDYNTGQCSCFDGYYGEACNLRSALAHG